MTWKRIVFWLSNLSKRNGSSVGVVSRSIVFLFRSSLHDVRVLKCGVNSLSILRILAIKFVFPFEKSWALKNELLQSRWSMGSKMAWPCLMALAFVFSWDAVRQSVKRHLNVLWATDGARLWQLTLTLPFISCLFFILRRRKNGGNTMNLSRPSSSIQRVFPYYYRRVRVVKR